MLTQSQKFLNQWKSGPDVKSTYNGIPISEISKVKQCLKDVLKDSGYTYNFRYRGPRIGGAYECLASNATSFSVYLKYKLIKKSKTIVPEFIVQNGHTYKLVK